MRDPLSRPRLFRALVELLKVHPEKMSLTQFCEATGYHRREAGALLSDLEGWGLTTRGTRQEGNARFLDIGLTQGGVVAARNALATEESVEAAKRAASKAQGRPESGSR